MALGSDASGILRLMLTEAASLVAVGLAGGLLGAIALRGAITPQLFGVGALDPLVMVSAVLILGPHLIGGVCRTREARGARQPAGGAISAIGRS